MHGIAENVLRPALFHDLAGIHDQHTAADLVDDTQVMGDQKDRCACLLIDPVQKLQHMGLRSDIESCRRFVRDQELGLCDDAHGDHDTLPHTARELMGIHTHGLCRIRKTCHGQCLQCPLFDLRMGMLSVKQQDFPDLGTDSVERVEAGHGFLKDHGHIISVDLTALRSRDRAKVPAVKHHAAFRHLDMIFEKILQCQCRHALAAAGLSDDPYDLTFSDGKADAVDHLVLFAVFID